MKKLTILAFFVSALICILIFSIVLSSARPTDNPMKIKWPSRRYPTIQSAVEALNDGGTLFLKKGTYELDQPIFIDNKRINIIGKANKKGKIRTRLITEPPIRVVHADRAIGVINLINNGSGSFKYLALEGSDAGIVNKDLRGTASTNIEFMHITKTGRGILWKSSSPLNVKNTNITDIEYNGVSIVSYQEIILESLYVSQAKNFCVFIKSEGPVISGTTINNSYFYGCQNGTIAAYNTLVDIKDNYILQSGFAGIWFLKASGWISGNWIEDTYPNSDGLFGDGIISYLSPFTIIENNNIEDNSRAGVSNFGSTVELKNNFIRCYSYELNGENVPGGNFTWIDNGGNICGCQGSGFGPCVTVSEGLEAPTPEVPPE